MMVYPLKNSYALHMLLSHMLWVFTMLRIPMGNGHLPMKDIEIDMTPWDGIPNMTINHSHTLLTTTHVSR